MIEDSVTLFFQVQRKELVYLKFILEAYEGMSTLSTVDQQRGIVQVVIPTPFLTDMKLLLETIGQEISLIPLEHPHAAAQE